MPNLTLRRVSQEVHRTLRRIAQENGRSLNAEILAILNKEAEHARRRRDLHKVIEEINRLREEVARKYPNQTDSAELIREDRDSR